MTLLDRVAESRHRAPTSRRLAPSTGNCPAVRLSCRRRPSGLDHAHVDPPPVRDASAQPHLLVLAGAVAAVDPPDVHLAEREVRSAAHETGSAQGLRSLMVPTGTAIAIVVMYGTGERCRAGA